MKEPTCFVEDLYSIIERWGLDKFSGVSTKDIFSVMMCSYESIVRIRAIFPDAIEERLRGKDARAGGNVEGGLQTAANRPSDETAPCP